jgi:glucokinase
MAKENEPAAQAIVGDFGGTNVRLALADLSQDVPVIGDVRHYHSKDFAQAPDTILAYRKETECSASVIAIAAAGPVNGGRVHFTNLGWSLSEADLKTMGFFAARVINDFVAVALATPFLTSNDVHQIGPGTPDKHLNVAVMGPGTGFGASALVMDNDNACAMAAESGHASFAPEDDLEIEILKFIRARFGHVSIERVLSGPGLRNIHDALNQLEGRDEIIEGPEEITRRALGGDAWSLRTLKRFCAILGSVAGNLALTYGALGGVYIAGGIAPDILAILDQSDFRRRFESKGRFVEYLKPIATCVITRADVAFLGSARAAADAASKVVVR